MPVRRIHGTGTTSDGGYFLVVNGVNGDSKIQSHQGMQLGLQLIAKASSRGSQYVVFTHFDIT